jgi:hypothetical protein
LAIGEPRHAVRAEEVAGGANGKRTMSTSKVLQLHPSSGGDQQALLCSIFTPAAFDLFYYFVLYEVRFQRD